MQVNHHYTFWQVFPQDGPGSPLQHWIHQSERLIKLFFMDSKLNLIYGKHLILITHVISFSSQLWAKLHPYLCLLAREVLRGNGGRCHSIVFYERQPLLLYWAAESRRERGGRGKWERSIPDNRVHHCSRIRNRSYFLHRSFHRSFLLHLAPLSEVCEKTKAIQFLANRSNAWCVDHFVGCPLVVGRTTTCVSVRSQSQDFLFCWCLPHGSAIPSREIGRYWARQKRSIWPLLQKKEITTENSNRTIDEKQSVSRWQESFDVKNRKREDCTLALRSVQFTKEWKTWSKIGNSLEQ